MRSTSGGAIINIASKMGMVGSTVWNVLTGGLPGLTNAGANLFIVVALPRLAGIIVY